MNIKQRDLILISYPFSNLENKKVRPAIVVSNNFFNENSKDCILIPVTSVIKDEMFSVMLEQKDLSSGKLIKSSRTRTDKLFCVDKELVIHKIGNINENKFEKIKEEISSLF